MDVEITRLDGKSVRFSESDVVVQDFVVSSIPVTGSYTSLEGRSGVIDYGAEYGQRIIELTFYIEAFDMMDYPLLRDELYAIITSREPFYVRELRRKEYGDGKGELVGGKRYLARVSEDVNLEQQFRYGFGTVALETVGLPFAESVGTTQDIEQGGVSSDSGLWGFGMGLVDEDEMVYTHTLPRFNVMEFKVYNAGNQVVHPFEQELKIKISNVKGSTRFLELRNKTNGTVFRINEGVTRDQTVIVDGAYVTINGLQAFRKTNRQYIEVDPGFNEFEVVGATNAKVEFDFRFYYL